MKIPSLFIIGAPKCGTTALATWLSDHPNVCFSTSKEPHFFSTDYQLTPTIVDYLSLFDRVSSKHHVIGEASVWYMHSSTAVKNILEYNNSAKFIVMLRNPVEMVVSMHKQQVFNGNELLRDLSDAIKQSDQRLKGVPVGVRPGYPPAHLAYLSSCALNWQVERLFQTVPLRQIKIIVHDDLKRDPRQSYSEVLRFLELSPIYPERFDYVNKARARRSLLVDSIVLNLVEVKKKWGVRTSFGFMSFIRRWNVKPAKRDMADQDDLEFLRKHFKSDVEKLGLLLKRDFSHWVSQ